MRSLFCFCLSFSIFPNHKSLGMMCMWLINLISSHLHSLINILYICILIVNLAPGVRSKKDVERPKQLSAGTVEYLGSWKAGWLTE